MFVVSPKVLAGGDWDSSRSKRTQLCKHLGPLCLLPRKPSIQLQAEGIYAKAKMASVYTQNTYGVHLAMPERTVHQPPHLLGGAAGPGDAIPELPGNFHFLEILIGLGY